MRRLAFVLLFLATVSGPCEAVHSNLKFDFGSAQVAPGYTAVLPDTVYTPERGYGFEPGTKIIAVHREEKDAPHRDFCTSDQPFLFSVKLPEGNYRVTVTLGDAEGESKTTIKAELRRLMLEHVHTARGAFVTRTFSVNVRTPTISTGGEVRLKDREKTTEWSNWDDKLTLEFNDQRPCVCTIEIEKTDNAITIFLLGDSTVCDQPREAFASWGQMLPRFFQSNVVVANHAESGESLKSSLGAGRLAKVTSLIKPGDYLFIQYGHNDQKEKGEGVGAFTTYQANLKKFIAAAREHGGLPVLVTSMHRRTFDANGKITNSLGDFPEAVRRAAAEENVPLIDLHAMSRTLYEALGPEGSKKLFNHPDGTHHCNYGSYELAKCVVEGIKADELGLARFLVTDLPAFDPAHPDPAAEFKVPPSPQNTGRKPDGN